MLQTLDKLDIDDEALRNEVVAEGEGKRGMEFPPWKRVKEEEKEWKRVYSFFSLALSLPLKEIEGVAFSLPLLLKELRKDISLSLFLSFFQRIVKYSQAPRSQCRFSYSFPLPLYLFFFLLIF